MYLSLSRMDLLSLSCSTSKLYTDSLLACLLARLLFDRPSDCAEEPGQGPQRIQRRRRCYGAAGHSRGEKPVCNDERDNNGIATSEASLADRHQMCSSLGKALLTLRAQESRLCIEDEDGKDTNRIYDPAAEKLAEDSATQRLDQAEQSALQVREDKSAGDQKRETGALMKKIELRERKKESGMDGCVDR